MSLAAFRSVSLHGNVLPADALTRAADLSMPGQSPDDYRLTPGLAINAAVARSWNDLLVAWERRQVGFQTTRGDNATRLTRERWLLPLLAELGYGRVPALPAGLDLPPGLGETKPAHYPISHQLAWPAGEPTPSAAIAIHLLGDEIELDKRTTGLTARAPHGMVQEFLNRTGTHLYAILATGRTIRLLRDASSLAKQSYVEFDLDLMFREQLFADFRLLWLTLHATRLSPRTQEPVAEPAPAATTADGDDNDPLDTPAAPAGPRADDCWLEQWRNQAISDGSRARELLEAGVARAVTALGTGFVNHPDNDQLRTALAENPNTDQDLRRWLLRLVYRYIVLFVAEDRDLLHPVDSTPTGTAARTLYRKHFSTARLRELAATRNGTRHSDLWDAHQIVTRALGTDGSPELALPPLASSLYGPDGIGLLAGARITNRYLLEAIRHLSQVRDKRTGTPTRVDYRNLDSEELGGIYEGLLAYVPRYDPAARTFTLTTAAGSERKTSGSFYTPSSLIALVLDETLNPLIDEALRAADPERAILDLTVCDPACGSGHFLVAAARRLARALATARTSDPEPSPTAVRDAMRDVVSRCIYGVDINDLAIEVAKVALWLEALTPGKPFAFLDHHLKVGNALLGTTPRLLAGNIPDQAFHPLHGDDKAFTNKLKARNKAERKHAEAEAAGQLSWDICTLDIPTVDIAKRAHELDTTAADTISHVRARADAWRRLQADPDLQLARLVHDAWCAAFVQEKRPELGPSITHAALTSLRRDPDLMLPQVKELIQRTARQYRFFHWHLEFPGVFTVPEAGTNTDSPHGWNGGFSAVIGNPPWETLSPDTREFFSELVPAVRTLSKSVKEEHITELLLDPIYADKWDVHQRELFATAHVLKRSGRYVMYAEGNLGKGDFNTYRSFIEAALTLTKPGGFAGQIVQSGIFSGANVSAIRQHLFRACTWRSVYGFNNKGGVWFPGVSLENFGAYIARVAVEPPPEHELQAAFGLHDPAGLKSEIAHRVIGFDPALIEQQNPETFAIPDIRDAQSARISQAMYKAYPGLGKRVEGLPQRDFSAELHMSDRNGVFGSDPGGVPVYEGRMIDFYDHRAKTYVCGHGNSSVWQSRRFGDPEKQIVAQWRVALSDLPNAQVRERIRHFRIGFMDVADPGRQRSFVSAYVPPHAVCGDKVPTLRFKDEWYGPVYLAVANSLVIDFLARQRTLSKKLALNIPEFRS
jgi:hypothetical protein